MFSGEKQLPSELAETAKAGRSASVRLGAVLLTLAVIIVAVIVNWPSIVKS
jgi:hypothetical protein